MKKKMRKVVRIFEDVGGYYLSDDSLDFLDARGRSYPTKAAALRAAREEWAPLGYTHAIGSGTYHPARLTKL